MVMFFKHMLMFFKQSNISAYRHIYSYIFSRIRSTKKMIRVPKCALFEYDLHSENKLYWVT